MLDEEIDIRDNNRSGSNQVGVKQFNERLVLDIVSTSKGLSKADITRITGLSAQTVTTIVNRLIDEALLKKGAVIKGKVGQPSTIIELDNQGATAIGIKIGRRSADILLVGLAAKVESRQSLSYNYPNAEEIFKWITNTVAKLINELPKAQVTKLIGIGVATPFDLDGWEGVINAPKGEMSKWKDIHVASEVERLTGQKTFLLNDATAACLAELRTSKDRQETSFLYFYVGTFLGGGIVLDGKIYNGIHGNAGSVGSMPTSLSSGKHPTQMVSAAAIHTLEVMAIKAGLPRNAFDNEEPLDLKRKEVFDDWSNEASNALAFAVISGQSFFDLGDIVIDGSIRRDLLGTLIEKIEESFTRYELQGLKVPNISAGHLGNDARAIGGSLLPLQQRYGLDQSLILKSNLTN
jgi:predicted NBD/HSP70 family sugar kinase